MLNPKDNYYTNSMLRHKIERILCPIDFTAASADALRYALAIAAANSAKLYIVHCAEQEKFKNIASLNEKLKEVITPYLVPSEVKRVEWEMIVTAGEIVDAIISEAATRRVDLIVMRSRRRPVASILLGSTAEAVSRIAPCPVLVTHPNEREWVNFTSAEIRLNRILVAYDFSDYAELALSYGLLLAQEYGAELHLLNVLSPKLENTFYPNTENTYLQTERRLQGVIPSEVYQWCKVKNFIIEGHPYQEVLAHARDNNINLICMGAHGANYNKWALFGSNVDRVLRQADCPIFIAHPLKPISASSAEPTKLENQGKKNLTSSPK